MSSLDKEEHVMIRWVIRSPMGRRRSCDDAGEAGRTQVADPAVAFTYFI